MSSDKKKKKITLIGAGLVGSLLAVYLTKRGYEVNIYERRPDMRKNRISAGRSINLALSDRGWKGLDGAGIGDEIRKVAIPMNGRMIHNLDGSLNFQAYGKEGQAIYSVSRGGLNCVMMDLAEKHGAKIFFEERCTHIDLPNATAIFQNASTLKNTSSASDLIIGTDGAFSAVRLALQLTDRFEYSQHYLEHGYKELTIDADPDKGFRLEKNALHIWPRGGYMLIALPNPDGSFTCTLFFPFKGDPSFESLASKKEVADFFGKVFPDAAALMPTLADDFYNNPTGSLVTVKCFPWSYSNTVMLIGDAAHAIVPFYGQGMNCGFEDCTVLNALLDKHADDWSRVIPHFENERKKAADGIAELAVQNFIEMRDLVGDKNFLLRKKIEAAFYTKHPDKWMPLYSMVTFSDLPYHIARDTGRKQDLIMDEVMKMDHIGEVWDTPEVESFILSKLV
jgi:kynurenine 3-monooxygenase